MSLDSLPGVYVIAGDTDGGDGQEEIAGAYLGPRLATTSLGQGRSPQGYLANNDGHGYFRVLDDSVITGPTLTNGNDFRSILITR